MGRTLVASAVVTALLFGGWLFTGNVRVGGLARDYFLTHHGNSTVVNVTIDAESPWIPPFWTVRIGGDVIEKGSVRSTDRTCGCWWNPPRARS